MLDRTPVLQALVNVLSNPCPETFAVYILLSKDDRKDSVDITKEPLPPGKYIQLIYGSSTNGTYEPPGLTAALLAAFCSCLEATWLVFACGYASMTSDALCLLQDFHLPPLTCHRNSKGVYEPLVGI